MIAHTLGNPFDLDAVASFAKKHNLWLIEDCCDALGATYNGQLVGTFGDLATVSFYPAHHITMGEGGAVRHQQRRCCKTLAESFRDWGRDCWCEPGKDNTCGKRFDWQLGELPCGYDHKYIYSHIGYNLKMTDMQAAVGLAQLQKLPALHRRRAGGTSAIFTSGSSRIEDVLVLPESTPQSEPSWFGFPIGVRDGAPFSRDAAGPRPGIRARSQPACSSAATWYASPPIRTSNIASPQISAAPTTSCVRYSGSGIFPGLNETMLDYVADTIGSFVAAQKTGGFMPVLQRLDSP